MAYKALNSKIWYEECAFLKLNLARNHDFLLPGELKLYFKKAKKW